MAQGKKAETANKHYLRVGQRKSQLSSHVSFTGINLYILTPYFSGAMTDEMMLSKEIQRILSFPPNKESNPNLGLSR